MILDFLFPNRCLECNLIIEGDEIICSACYSHIDFSHFGFNANHLLLQRCRSLFPTDNAFALMLFGKENLARKILHQLKYGNREIIGKILALWTIQKLTFEPNLPDLITTIPLHSSKQKQRGFNQLHLFGNILSEHYQIPIDHQLLKRNTSNKAQARRNKEQRSNYNNQFSLNKEVNNQHVLIIDDVFTTGNTMSRAAWEILSGNNNKISILVMAID